MLTGGERGVGGLEHAGWRPCLLSISQPYSKRRLNQGSSPVAPAAEGLSHQTVRQLPGKALHQPALTQIHQRTHLQGIGRRGEVAEG